MFKIKTSEYLVIHNDNYFIKKSGQKSTMCIYSPLANSQLFFLPIKMFDSMINRRCHWNILFQKMGQLSNILDSLVSVSCWLIFCLINSALPPSKTHHLNTQKMRIIKCNNPNNFTLSRRGNLKCIIMIIAYTIFDVL